MKGFEALEQLMELQSRHQTLHGDWLKHLLTLAVGALTVLSSLRPEPATPIEAYLLAATWAFLGAGIIFGAAATYSQVSIAKRFARRVQEQIERDIHAGRPVLAEPVIENASIVFSLMPPLMVLSLLSGVCSLVAFSVSATLP